MLNWTLRKERTKKRQKRRWLQQYPHCSARDAHYLSPRQNQMTIGGLRTGHNRHRHHMFIKFHFGHRAACPLRQISSDSGAPTAELSDPLEQLARDLSCSCCLLFVGCLTSLPQASVSQGRICSDIFTCCHTEVEAANQTFYLTQSQYTNKGPTFPVLTL